MVFILLLSSPVAASPQGGHWADPSVEFVAALGALPPGGFRDLNSALNPVEWNAIVSRVLGLVPESDGMKGSLRHSVAQWTMGLETTTSSVVSRGQAFGGLMRVFGLYGVVDTESVTEGDERVFTDWQDISPEYRGLLAQATRDGLITGYPDGRFLPGRMVTVAEGLVFLHRALERYGFMEAVRVPRIAGASARESAEDGITLVIYTDRTWYCQDEKVAVVAGAENKGDTSVAYTKWRVGDPAIYVWAEVGTSRVFLEEEGLSPLRLPAVTFERLPASSALIQRLVWDLSSTPGIKPGVYALQASFYPLRSSENPANPDIIRVRLEVEVRAPEKPKP
jgi:hypothetical protein